MTQGETFLHHVLGELLPSTELYTIECKVDEQGTLYSVHVDPSEMGKIIGRGGKNVEALKTLLKMLGSKTGEHLSMKVMEKTD